jgi:ribosomal protein S18 acetylase RimI-like enzyme
MKIREMSQDDVDPIITIGLGEEGFQVSEGPTVFWSREQLLASIESGTNVLLVVEDGDAGIVGFAICLGHVPSKKVTFENLWVDPSVRRKGVSGLLIQESLERLRKLGYEYICALTKTGNESILGALEKSGFDRGHSFNWVEKNI